MLARITRIDPLANTSSVGIAAIRAAIPTDWFTFNATVDVQLRYSAMKLFLLVSLLGFSLVQEGVCTHLETCNCNEIAELVNTTVQQAAASLEYKLSLMVNTAISNINITSDDAKFDALKNDLTSAMERLLKPIKTQLEYHLPPPPPVNNSKQNPAKSCKTLYADYPHAASGYYWIGTRGSPIRVHCNMTGGWMRVAYIDMRDTSHQCPSGLTLFSRSSPPRRVCNVTGYGCVSTTFTVHGVEYSHVRGRIIGYQIDAPAAFYYHTYTIDQTYIFGVSLTHGQNPRKHIWSFAGGRDEGSDNTYQRWRCPCINNNLSPPSVASFIGNDYFCDTAYHSYNAQGLESSDPLWDGKGCGPTSTCCSFNRPPWFTKDFPSPTTDNIEMRLCRRDYAGTTPIELVELYIQ